MVFAALLNASHLVRSSTRLRECKERIVVRFLALFSRNAFAFLGFNTDCVVNGPPGQVTVPPVTQPPVTQPPVRTCPNPAVQPIGNCVNGLCPVGFTVCLNAKYEKNSSLCSAPARPMESVAREVAVAIFVVRKTLQSMHYFNVSSSEQCATDRRML